MIVAFDLETYLIERTVLAPKPVCCSFASHDEGAFVLTDFVPRIAYHLDRGDTLVVHNAAFDIPVLLTHCPSLRTPIFDALDEGRIRCTALRERLINIACGERQSTSLAEIVKRLFDVVLDKETWRLGYAALDGVPLSDWPDGAVQYVLDDAQWCLRLHDAQEREALPTQDIEVRASIALGLCSVRGFVVDRVAVDALSSSLHERMSALRADLVADGVLVPKRKRDATAFAAGTVKLDDIALRKDTKRLRELAQVQGVQQRTPTGKVALSRTALAGVEGFADVTEYAGIEKTLSTYVRAITDVDSVHARYYALGAVSGRTSCAKPNLQNLPRTPGVRECFVSRPGYSLISCDYDAQEMRTLAQACLLIVGWSTLADRFRSDPDFDPHTEAAAGTAFSRQEMKAGNFGFPGGMGIKTFVAFARTAGVDLDDERAMGIKRAWLERWPEMADYFSHVAELTGVEERQAQIEIPTTGFVRGACGYSDACNGYFQGLAATVSKEALWRVTQCCHDERCESWLLGSRIVAFIHDEIIIESPTWASKYAAVALQDEMIEAAELWCPDVPFKASARIMDRWSK